MLMLLSGVMVALKVKLALLSAGLVATARPVVGSSNAVAFWMLYRPAARCGVDGSCIAPDALRRRRRWLWLATALIVLLLLFPYYIVWIL